MALSLDGLRRMNLLDSPSTLVVPGALYWLVYSLDTAVDLRALREILGPMPYLVVIADGWQDKDVAVVPIRIDRTTPSGKTVGGVFTESVRDVAVGLDLTFLGLGVGPRIGGGAYCRLKFVKLDTAGDRRSLEAKAQELIAAAQGAVEVKQPVEQAVTRAVSSVTSTVQQAGGTVFGTLKLVLWVALIGGAIWLYLQVRKGK